MLPSDQRRTHRTNQEAFGERQTRNDQPRRRPFYEFQIHPPGFHRGGKPSWRPIKYSLFPPLGLATLARYLSADDQAHIVDQHAQKLTLAIQSKRLNLFTPLLEAVLPKVTRRETDRTPLTTLRPQAQCKLNSVDKRPVGTYQ